MLVISTLVMPTLVMHLRRVTLQVSTVIVSRSIKCFRNPSIVQYKSPQFYAPETAMASNEDRVFDPLEVVRSIRKLAERHGRYESIFSDLKAAEQRISASADPSQTTTFSVFDNPQAKREIVELCKSQYRDKGCGEDEFILDCVLEEYFGNFRRNDSDSLCGHLEHIPRGFNLICNTNIKDEQDEIHASMHDDLSQAKAVVDWYRTSGWSWILREDLLNQVQALKLGKGTLEKQKGAFRNEWAHAMTVARTVDELWMIFCKIREIDGCEVEG